MTGAELFTGMDTGDIDILRADLTAARRKAWRVYAYPAPDDLADELTELISDLHDAWTAAFDQETGAQRAAEIWRAVHVDTITKAERLLAAERAA
jgi:hypothetical protein